jgi:hypothetical protein
MSRQFYYDVTCKSRAGEDGLAWSEKDFLCCFLRLLRQYAINALMRLINQFALLLLDVTDSGLSFADIRNLILKVRDTKKTLLLALKERNLLYVAVGTKRISAFVVMSKAGSRKRILRPD